MHVHNYNLNLKSTLFCTFKCLNPVTWLFYSFPLEAVNEAIIELDAPVAEVYDSSVVIYCLGQYCNLDNAPVKMMTVITEGKHRWKTCVMLVKGKNLNLN